MIDHHVLGTNLIVKGHSDQEHFAQIMSTQDHRSQHELKDSDTIPSHGPEHIPGSQHPGENMSDSLNTSPLSLMSNKAPHTQPKPEIPHHHRRDVSNKLDRGSKVESHSLVLWLFLLYAVVAIFAWTVTCVLCFHPIGIPTWTDQWGNYSSSSYSRSDRIRGVANVGLSIISTTGIPLTSAITARAAVPYCQRNKDSDKPALTMRQMLALADKGWTGIEYFRDILRPSKTKRVVTPLLIYAVGLVGVGESCLAVDICLISR